jgi:hypothetical protein
MSRVPKSVLCISIGVQYESQTCEIANVIELGIQIKLWI